MTADLTVTVNDQPVPLKECGWLQRRPCGCIVAAVLAVVDAESGWTLATAEQATQHFGPTRSDRDEAERAGLHVELITMTHYRTNIRSTWECEQHTTGRKTCTAGLLPVGDGPVEPCVTVTGARWTDADSGVA